jgi:hypothetical protein
VNDFERNAKNLKGPTMFESIEWKLQDASVKKPMKNSEGMMNAVLLEKILISPKEFKKNGDVKQCEEFQHESIMMNEHFLYVKRGRKNFIMASESIDISKNLRIKKIFKNNDEYCEYSEGMHFSFQNHK